MGRNLTIATGLLAVVIGLLSFGPQILRSNLPENFGGFVEPGFESVKDMFRQNFENGWDYEGAAFAVCHKGKLVVDLWGGYADSRANKLWQEDTLTVAFSTTKAACAICLAILVDRGLISYDDPVSRHWPEFAQNGKENVTVKMLATHQAGLAALNINITFDLIRDWSKMGQVLANHEPNWAIGPKRHGYHAVTYGFLIDQLIRRVDPLKRSVGKFFRDEVAVPHGLEFYIGLPENLEPRVTQLTPISKWVSAFEIMKDPKIAYVAYKLLITPSALLTKIRHNPPWLEPDENGNITFNDPELHKLEVGAAAGIGTARALAKLFCLLNNGKLVKKSTFDRFLRPIFAHSQDLVLKIPISIGHGFFYAKNPHGNYTFGHSGYGGQNVKLDPNFGGISFAYLRNGLSLGVGDLSWSYQALESAVYDVILGRNVNKS